MDPHAEQVPGLALPKPASERGVGNATPYQPGATPETSLSAIETVSVPPGPPAMGQAQLPAAFVQPALATPAAGVANPLVATQAADDNTDALDEEWINKAKAIVEQTKHDPHLESQELGRVKADYLRVRYNKHIKLPEDHTK